MERWIIIEVFVNFFQILIIYKFLDLYYDRRFECRYSVESVIVLMALILTILNYSFQIQKKPLLYVAFYFFIFIIIAIIFKGSFFSKAVMLFFILAAIGTFEILSAALVTTISGYDLGTIQEQSNVRLEVMLISQTLFMFFYIRINMR